MIRYTSVSVVSAASFTASVAPGSIASAFGAQLCLVTAQAELDANGELPTVLGGTVVEVNGIAAGLYYVSPTQINFIVPRSLQAGAATVVIRSGIAGVSLQSRINVTDLAPAIFILAGARADIGAIRNAVTFDLEPFKLETSENGGCDKRTHISVFATGLSLAARLGLKVQVEIKDKKDQARLLDVDYAGPSSYPGLDQVNIALPPELGDSGNITLILKVGASVSNTVNIDLVPGTIPSSVCLAGLEVSSAVITAGAQITGTVSLSSLAPRGGIIVNLQGNNPGLHIPASLTIPEGHSSATFNISADANQTLTAAAITATLGPISLSANLSINLICITRVQISSLS